MVSRGARDFGIWAPLHWLGWGWQKGASDQGERLAGWLCRQPEAPPRLLWLMLVAESEVQAQQWRYGQDAHRIHAINAQTGMRGEFAALEVLIVQREAELEIKIDWDRLPKGWERPAWAEVPEEPEP
jgi:hypothetical protein